jgi:DNA repair protein RAD50
MQSTVQKSGKNQFKSLEGSIRWNHRGENNVSSSRVNDLDTIVPEKLGVSPAILEAVIFTHQEESLWPMSEPTYLKKRFDEIFEAQRYTKAIDSIKSVMKTQKLDLVRLQEQDKAAKAAKVESERKHREMKTIEREMEEMRDEAVDLEAKAKAEEDKMFAKEAEAESVRTFVTDLKEKKQALATKQDIVNDLRDGLEELLESDSTLQTTLDQYENRISRLQEEADRRVVNYKQLEKDLKSTRDALGDRNTAQGKHQSDKERFEQNVATRATKVKGAAYQHGLRGFEGELDDQKVIDFFKRLNKMLQDKRADVQRIQLNNSEELDELNREVQAAEGRKQARVQERGSAKKRMETIDKDINRRNQTLAKNHVDEGARLGQVSRLEGLTVQLAKARSDATNPEAEAALRAEYANVKRLEADGEALAQEMLECNKLASQRAQLDVHKGELVTKKRELDTLVDTWKGRLSHLIDNSWSPATIENEFQEVLRRQQKAVEDANNQRDIVQQEMNQLDFKLNAAREKRKKAGGDDARSRAAVKRALDSIGEDKALDEYTTLLESLEADVAEADQDLKLFGHMADYWSKSEKALKEKNCCSMCDRTFEPSQAVKKTKLAEKIARNLSEDAKKGIEEDLKQASRKLDTLKAARPHYDNYVRARADIVSLEKEIKALEIEKAGVLRRLEEHDTVCREMMEKRQEFETTGKTVASISMCHSQITDLQARIERSTSQLSQSGSLRSVDEINEQQKANKDQVKVAKDKLQSLEAEKQRSQQALNALTIEQMDLKNRVERADELLAQNAVILEEIGALKADYETQRKAIQQIDQNMELLDLEVAKARTIKDDAVQRGRTKEQKAVQERDELAATANELKLTEDAIQAYIDDGSAAKMETNAKAIEALQVSIANTEKEMADVTTQINRMRSEITDSDKHKRNIRDNLKLRDNLRAMGELEAAIATLEQRNDAADHERLIQERDVYKNRLTKLNSQYERLVGKLNQKDEDLAHRLDEWDKHYKDAAQEYKETHIKKETTDAIIADLKQYSAAIEKAVMQYHSLKMAEINRIAGELWQSTYQGTDIDTILIRADNPTEKKPTASGRRNYDYRVCMVKADTEMDMRGRCSAGQKVLASIIIRLALAESFGIGCGLIALDEPTTNLDSDNIKSLAVSLHRIIEARRSQSNFQLIVITHDEEFLRHMQVSEFADKFYRVSRNHKQCSEIRAQGIANLEQ